MGEEGCRNAPRVGVRGMGQKRYETGKYVPSGARAGAKGRGETMTSKRGKIGGRGL